MMASILSMWSDSYRHSVLIVSDSWSNKVLSRDFPEISFFAMLRKIKALHFMLLSDSQSDGHINNLQDNKCSHDRQAPCDCDTNKLVCQLAIIPFYHSRGDRVALRVLKDRIHCARRKDSGENRAESTTRSMHPKGVERVIITEARLYCRNHEITECSGN